MIPITYFRSSSFSTHSMCPMKYFNDYILGWPGEGNKAADRGTIIHKCLEVLANLKKNQQEGKKTYTDKDIKMRVSDKTDVDKIIERVYKYFTEAFDHHTWEESDYKTCKKLTHMALNDNEGNFDPRNLNIVEVEGHFDFDIEEDWAKYKYEVNGEIIEGYLSLKGTIDLITQLDEETLEVIDWKSGKRLNWATGEVYTLENLKDNIQLRLYHLALTKMYPHIKYIMVTINYIKEGGPYTISFDENDIPETLRRIREKFELIRDTKIPKLNKSWKCTRFCNQGMSTFEDTNVSPIVELREGCRTPIGNIMTKCEQVLYSLKHRSTEEVINNMTKEGYNVTSYKAPGEIE